MFVGWWPAKYRQAPLGARYFKGGVAFAIGTELLGIFALKGACGKTVAVTTNILPHTGQNVESEATHATRVSPQFSPEGAICL